MTAGFAPREQAGLEQFVRDAAEKRQPLAISGGGTRIRPGDRARGEPVSTRNLSAITLYEPREMVISARAGTPLAEVEAALAGKGQMLPFEPMDHRGLLGTRGEPTIGAVAACNVSGPRRVALGAARDHLIGISLVNGRGETIRSGGRVMKNVTGLDLVKLNAGAFGTLGVLTDVTFKVLPRPETQATLVLEDLPPQRALDAMAEAMTTPFEVSAAAYRPADTGRPSQTLLRLEGFAESCAYRSGRLADHLAPFGAVSLREADETRTIWRAVRDADDLADGGYAHLLRVHVAPSKAPALLAIIEENAAGYLIDWAGGLVWLGLDEDRNPATVAAAIAGAGGHPMVVRSESPEHAYMPPASPAIRALGERIKKAFDPAGIFNPSALRGHL